MPRQVITTLKSEPSKFDQKVYEALKTLVPAGYVTTYKALAEYAGGSARSIGQSMRRNPYAPVVPCHRVVASDLSLGGFHGHKFSLKDEMTQKKFKMLVGEGVVVDELTGKIDERFVLRSLKKL